jgi:hypothetical protein
MEGEMLHAAKQNDAADNALKSEPRSLNRIVFDEEQLFREVKDWAFLLANRLWETTPIEGQEQDALGRVAGELLSIGHKLDALFEELFEINRQARRKGVQS